MRDFLAQLTYYRTYPKTLSDGSKETWNQIIDRNVEMHCRKYPHITDEIVANYNLVRRKLVLPSMRSLQFGGEAIEKCNARMYNCSALALTNVKAFGELTYLLMCGCGTGYSVQLHHITQLPTIKAVDECSPHEVYIIPDTKEGWADSVRKLIKNPRICFDYSQLRPAGAIISAGGSASGPAPLKRAHEKIRTILLMAGGRQLTSVECSDIACYIADMVVVGSVRRSAMICLFSMEDKLMRTYKERGFDIQNPQRYRVNITTVLNPDEVTARKFGNIFYNMVTSEMGEPGFFWSRDKEYLLNPCAEISLRNKGLCNLTEVNLPLALQEGMLLEAVKAATFIGTLQAGYTDFGYLSPEWTINAREEALLGVSFTGMGLVPNGIIPKDIGLVEAAIEENKRVAALIGINASARIGTVKPSGTASIVLGVSSGIHAAFSKFYLRRVRVDIDNPLAKALVNLVGFVGEPESGEFLERDASSSNQIIVTLPIHMQGEDAVYASEEGAVQFLERVKHTHTHWIKPTHMRGPNTNNVSATVYYKETELEAIRKWCFSNRDSYTALSFMLYSDTTGYKQLPFECIDEDTYIRKRTALAPLLKLFDFNSIDWTGTEDGRKNELSCAGGACLLGE
jgi:ribonucleoside-diphosphate reductase alpha chain